MNDLKVTPEQAERFVRFVAEDDLDFYEREVMHLPADEQQAYFRDNPEFMQDYAVSRENGVQIDLLQDASYRGILRKIKGKQAVYEEKSV